MNQTRRSFFKTTLAATAALSLPARIYAAAEGSNSDIRIAGIGFNGRGMSNIQGLLGVKGVRLTALC
ncbi:MAG: gfo/Idh/MocA family oxidoreductase, partial [Verrucomicrobiaceae bacterium]